jgi:hypothetical protein
VHNPIDNALAIDGHGEGATNEAVIERGPGHVHTIKTSADFFQMSELSEWKTRESLPQGRGSQRGRRVHSPNQSNHECIDANTSAFLFVLRALWAPSLRSG